MVYIILKPGFEEIEAISIGDILRRGEVECRYVSDEALPVRGAHGICVTADMSIDDLHAGAADMVVIPGGLGGVTGIEGCAKTLSAIREAALAGAALGAICAGPRVFSKLDLLRGRRITCYPGMEAQMYGAAADTSKSTVIDGNMITGRAPGASIDFGLAVLEYLAGREKAEEIRGGLVYGF